MLRNRLFRNGSSEPPGFAARNVPAEPTPTRLEYAGDVFDCRVVESSDGGWTLAYGRRTDGTESRVFRFSDGRLVDSQSVSRPIAGAIATDGVAALVTADGPETLGGTLEVFGDDGMGFERTFESNLGRPAITDAGDRVAISTRPPESTVLLFDPRMGTCLGSCSVRNRTVRVLGFHGDDNGMYLYAGVRNGDEPYLAMNLDGEVVWGSDRYRATRSLTERVAGVMDRFRGTV